MALIDGDNSAIDYRFDNTAYNRLKNHFVQSDPVSNLSNPQEGMIVHDSDDDKVYSYDGAAYDRIHTENQPLNLLVEGSIMAWAGGYMTDGSNGGYTRVLGSDNTVAAVNTLLNSSGLYVCDGSALNLATSTIFNGASRFLPHLTDDRFLMGDTTIGGIGGSSTMAHTHPVGTYAVSSHTHTIDIPGFPTNQTGIPTAPYTSSVGPGAVFDSADDHLHSLNVAQFNSGATVPTLSGSSGAASQAENRPKYLAVFYLLYVFT